MRQRFDTLTNDILGQLSPGEDATLHLQAESSDFVRFNRGRVRQPGHVTHGRVVLRLLRGQRHASVSFNLGDDDRAQARDALAKLRGLIEVVPEDPHLLWEQQGQSTEHVQDGTAASAEEIVHTVVEAAADLDLVGILAAGDTATGFASSRGQRNWDHRHSWLFDWCLYARGDKAHKSTMGGSDFDPDRLRTRIEAGRQQLAILGEPVRTLKPGSYRVFLAPAAVEELMSLVGNDGFSHRAHQTHSSALGRLERGEAALSGMLNLSEDIARGLGPGFSPEGFQRPDRVSLVRAGQLVDKLVSPRSARQYGVPTTGAGRWEAPESLSMAGGELDNPLQALGTGLYISNLWYLNFSDHTEGRITGMTRFATVWVEDGRAVAPTEVMRFDDTVFDLLGPRLQGLTREVELLPSASTYGMRSTSSSRLPGALIDGMTFTL